MEENELSEDFELKVEAGEYTPRQLMSYFNHAISGHELKKVGLEKYADFRDKYKTTAIRLFHIHGLKPQTEIKTMPYAKESLDILVNSFSKELFEMLKKAEQMEYEY